jgi:hypothetical protein
MRADEANAWVAARASAHVVVGAMLVACSMNFEQFDPANAGTESSSPEADSGRGGPDAANGGDSGGGGFDAANGGDSGAGGLDAADADAGAGEGGALDAANDGGALTVGLVAFYRFDETSGTSAADSSGNNQTATLGGGATFASGLQNNAVTMTGSGQYVSLPSGIVSGIMSFSICAWVKLNAAPSWARIFDFGTGTTAFMFLTPTSATSTTRFAIATGGTGMEQQINAPALPTGSWQHVALTLAGSTGTLYVNGIQVGQNTTMTLYPASLGSTNQNWLGRSEFGDPYLNGQIDNFRIYSRALTAAEIQTLDANHL